VNQSKLSADDLNYLILIGWRSNCEWVWIVN